MQICRVVCDGGTLTIGNSSFGEKHGQRPDTCISIIVYRFFGVHGKRDPARKLSLVSRTSRANHSGEPPAMFVRSLVEMNAGKYC